MEATHNRPNSPAISLLGFWIACGITVLSTALLAVTFVWSHWVEIVFSFDPDGGSAAVEWMIALILLTAASGSFRIAFSIFRQRRIAIGEQMSIAHPSKS